MASADTCGCETHEGQLTSALKYASPALDRADHSNHSHTASEPQNALEEDEEQQEPAEDDDADSLAARVKDLPDATDPAEYTMHTPPWYPNQQRLGESEHCRIPQQYDILRGWFAEHAEHPHPTEQEKGDLAQRTGMTYHQVANWFINARRRNEKGREAVEEEEVEEKPDRWKAAERPVGGRRFKDGEITLEWDGDGKTGSDKPAQTSVGVQLAGEGYDDWEILSLSDEEEQKAMDKEAVAEQQIFGKLSQA